MAAVVNPLGHKEDTDVAAEDTDAVTSPGTQDLALLRFASAWFATALAVPLTVASALVLAVGINTYQTSGVRVSELARLANVCAGISIIILAIHSPTSVRQVTAVDGGELGLLGAGKAKISLRVMRSLKRAHALCCFIAAFLVFFSLVNSTGALKVGQRSAMSGRFITAQYAYTVILPTSASVTLVIAMAFAPWWLTLKLASALVSDAVAEVCNAVKRWTPADSEWQSEVVGGVVRLNKEILPCLSKGWGNALGLTFATFWFAAMTWFCFFLEAHGTSEVVTGVLTGLFIYLPLGVADDAAAASSLCDTISDAITTKREDGPKGDPMHEHALCLLEKLLDRKNTRQGLGLVVFGTVIDTKTLNKIRMGLLSGATTVVPIVLALRPSASVEEGVPSGGCSITDAQEAALAALVASFNQSCSFNITVN